MRARPKPMCVIYMHNWGEKGEGEGGASLRNRCRRLFLLLFLLSTACWSFRDSLVLVALISSRNNARVCPELTRVFAASGRYPYPLIISPLQPQSSVFVVNDDARTHYTVDRCLLLFFVLRKNIQRELLVGLMLGIKGFNSVWKNIRFSCRTATVVCLCGLSMWFCVFSNVSWTPQIIESGAERTGRKKSRSSSDIPFINESIDSKKCRVWKYIAINIGCCISFHIEEHF